MKMRVLATVLAFAFAAPVYADPNCTGCVVADGGGGNGCVDGDGNGGGGR